MLLRRLEVFFIVLMLVTTGYHIIKHQEKTSKGTLLELKPRLPLLKTPILLGYGPIRTKSMRRRSRQTQ